MSTPNTHARLSAALCGHLVTLDEGRALVRLETTDAMRADDHGLVHGGFVFGAVDHAAMLAVNDPNVVLGGAEVRFTAPVAVGQAVDCEATVQAVDRRKRVVAVEARVGEAVVLTGTLTCFVLDQHVLDGR